MKKFAEIPLIISFSFVLLLFGMNRSVNIYDEGFVVYGAERILNGEVPYRDFWELYGPAQVWTIAGLFKLFGSSLIVERIWDTVVRALLSFAIYMIASRWASRSAALIVWLSSLGWLWFVDSYAYPVFPALLFGLGGAYFFINYLVVTAKLSHLIVSGAMVGVTAAFRHDIGFYFFLAQLVSLALLQASGKYQNKSVGLFNGARLFEPFRYLGLGVALTGIPVATILLWQVPISDLIDQLIVFPATILPKMRSLPYPDLRAPYWEFTQMFTEGSWWKFLHTIERTTAFYFHFSLIAAAIYVLVKPISKEKVRVRLNSQRVIILFLSILIVALFSQSIVRPDFAHIIHVILTSLVLSAVLLDYCRRTGMRWLAWCVVLAIIGVSAGPLTYALVRMDNISSALKADSSRKNRNISQFFQLVTSHSNGSGRARYFRISDDQAEALNFVREHVPPKEKIFVGTGQHDRIFINDVLFYFLSERHSATKYSLMLPGLTTTAATQRKIVNELLENNVKYVVLYSGHDDKKEPNGSSISSGVKLLDDFLLDNYSEIESFGNYVIKKRN